MTKVILTNIQLHQIEQKIEKILADCDNMNPEIFEDAEKLTYYNEILTHYESLLKESFKRARISESGLRLV